MIRLNNSLSQYCYGITFLLWGILVSVNMSSYGQQHGLRFSGSEVPQNQRTTLDLSPNSYFSFKKEFTLSFQLTFPAELQRYFGYIIRIIDDNNRNVDLIFNYRNLSETSLNIIYLNEQTNILIETNLEELFENWEEVLLEVDLQKKNLKLSFGQTSIVAQNILLSRNVRFLFGGNNDNHFKTNTLAPMIMRDIKLSEGKKLLHHWPLNEIGGHIANDIVNNRNGVTTNPTWIGTFFRYWRTVYNDTISGQASVAFNSKDGVVYIAGHNSVINFHTSGNNALKYGYNNDFPHRFAPIHRAFYNAKQDKLCVYDIRNTSFNTFCFDSLKWDTIFTGPEISANYWHHNNQYLPTEEMLLIFGGYGQYEYRNDVHRFSFLNNQYDRLTTIGDVYYPRYLASLGYFSDTILLLGGHGSVSGKQVEGPQNFYDLTIFSLKDNRFLKKYDFIPPIEDVVFANSMVIDQSGSEFYALAFPNYSHHSYLQLLKGSMYEPNFELVGDRIPFRFMDILSFADLYYCHLTKQLIAVTLYYNNEIDKTHASIYTISVPPASLLKDKHLNEKHFLPVFFISLLIASLLIIFIAMYRYFRKKSILPYSQIKLQGTATDVRFIYSQSGNENTFLNRKNALYFFDGLKIFNRDGVNITHKFTPLLKELFLLIWLNSLKGNIGVSPEKLKEVFWCHMDEKKAISNRAVNIGKLKSLLEEIDTCKLSRQSGYWKIEFNKSVVFNDYLECLNLIRSEKTHKKEDITYLISIIANGAFFDDLSYDWLNTFKSEISNSIIDTLVNFGQSYDIKKDPDFVLSLANTIFCIDIINEEALVLKCKALIAEGKLSMAQNCYLDFTKKYNSLYEREFEISFNEIIK